MLSQKVEDFSENFIDGLGKYVLKQEVAGKKTGLDEETINAIMTKSFYLLGKQHAKFAELAHLE